MFNDFEFDVMSEYRFSDRDNQKKTLEKRRKKGNAFNVLMLIAIVIGVVCSIAFSIMGFKIVSEIWNSDMSIWSKLFWISMITN